MAFVRIYRLTAAALIVAAVGYQLGNTGSVVNFFSYFTILSNVFGAAVFVLAAVGRSTDLLRGAAVLYLVTTGIVFALLLADISADVGLTRPWVDTVLHRVMPVVFALDWLIDPPRRAISIGAAARWLIFPLVYAAYGLIRGPIADWYPYPFLDPREHGYGTVALNCLGIAAGVILLAALIRWVGNGLRRRRSSRSPT